MIYTLLIVLIENPRCPPTLCLNAGFQASPSTYLSDRPAYSTVVTIGLKARRNPENTRHKSCAGDPKACGAHSHIFNRSTSQFSRLTLQQQQLYFSLHIKRDSKRYERFLNHQPVCATAFHFVLGLTRTTESRWFQALESHGGVPQATTRRTEPSVKKEHFLAFTRRSLTTIMCAMPDRDQYRVCKSEHHDSHSRGVARGFRIVYTPLSAWTEEEDMG